MSGEEGPKKPKESNVIDFHERVQAIREKRGGSLSVEEEYVKAADTLLETAFMVPSIRARFPNLDKETVLSVFRAAQSASGKEDPKKAGFAASIARELSDEALAVGIRLAAEQGAAPGMALQQVAFVEELLDRLSSFPLNY